MMAGRGGGQPSADGGLARHIPVLGGPAVDFLNVRDGGVYVDATFGAGGYTARHPRRRQLQRHRHRPRPACHRRRLRPGVAGAKAGWCWCEDRFSNLEGVARSCGYDAVDGVVLDVGVSSMQLDEAARGFSFRFDGPLDMRMGGEGPSAADVVKRASERDLAAIIKTLGEERHARAVARAIVRARDATPIETTGALAEIVGRVVHARPDRIHPATRTFQALRIFVNEELDELAAALEAAERVLRPGGRLVVVSFHSLEDRIVKTFLTARGRRSAGSRHAPEAVQAPPSLRILTGRPVIADDAETAVNPRARSAKLRAAERTDAPAGADIKDELLPRIPSIVEVMTGRRQP